MKTKQTACLAALVCIMSAASCTKTAPQTFENPVIRQDVPDPTIIRVGEDYYAAGTSGNASQVYPMFHSRDLVHWDSVGHVFAQWPDWTMGSFWAPELFQNGDTFLCYYTARDRSDSTSCIGVATAPSPIGPFTDRGPLVKWTNEAIDSYVFNDEGQLYITWKAYGLNPERPIELLASRLSADGLQLEGEPFSLLTDYEDLGMEGQCIFRHGKYYYLLYAARDCCTERSDYEVRVARATQFQGPYEKYEGNPILRGDGAYIQSCGHGTLVQTPGGKYYYLCHSYLIGRYKEGRQPILQELTIGEDGWPHFATGDVTVAEQPWPDVK